MGVAIGKYLAIVTAGAALAVSAPAIAADLPQTVLAQQGKYAPASPLDELAANHKRKHRHWDDDDRYYGDRHYGDRRYSRYDPPVYRDTRAWRGRDGRYYCRRDDGTTGLLIGAGVGGLIGNEVAGRGDKSVGVLLGAVGGAILGREIDRSGSRCR